MPDINGDKTQPAPADRPVHQHYDAARGAFAAEDLEAAERHCAQALAEEGDYLAALELGGVVACRLGRLELGIQRFEALAAAVPDNGGAWFNLGNARLEAGQPKPAAEALSRALELAPDNPNILIALGAAERHLRQLADSEAHLRQALELAPENLAALNALGATLAEQRKYAAALEVFQQAVHLQPRTAQLRHNVGNMLLEMARYDEAVEEYRAALTLAPRDADFRLGLASALSGRGEYDEAIHHLKKALRHHPEHRRARFSLIDILEHQNRLDEAQAHLAPLQQKSPSDPNVALLVARMAVRSGDAVAALRALEAVDTARLPTLMEPRYYREYGAVCDRLGRTGPAMMAFSRANHAMAQRWRALSTGPNEFRRQVTHASEVLEDGALSDLPAGPSEGAPIFLVGFPRSGTTLLGRILDAHSGLATADEVPMLGQLADRIRQRGAYPEGLSQLGVDEVAALRQTYFAGHGREEGAGLVDKLPLNLVHGLLIRRLFGRAPIVLTHRDPRDVVLSCFMQTFDLNAAMANFFTLESAARLYQQVMTFWERQCELFDFNVTVLRYEELLAAPEKTLRALCEQLEIEYQPSMLDFHRRENQASSSRTPSYSRVGDPLDASAVGRWRQYQEHLAPVMPRLAPFVERYGYPADSAD